MKKRILIGCFAALLAFTLSGCGGGGNSLGGSRGTPLGETIGYETTFSIDGTVFAFPHATAADFESDGWVIEDEYASDILATGDRGGAAYYKGENYIRLHFYNITETDLPINECQILKIELHNFALEGIDMVLAGGLTFGMTTDDIISRYGEPSYHRVDDGGDYEFFDYDFDNPEETDSPVFNDARVSIKLNEEKSVSGVYISLEIRALEYL